MKKHQITSYYYNVDLLGAGGVILKRKTLSSSKLARLFIATAPVTVNGRKVFSVEKEKVFMTRTVERKM